MLLPKSPFAIRWSPGRAGSARRRTGGEESVEAREIAVMAQEHARRFRQGFRRAREACVGDDRRDRGAVVLSRAEGFLNRLVADRRAVQLALQHDGDAILLRDDIGALIA